MTHIGFNRWDKAVGDKGKVLGNLGYSNIHLNSIIILEKIVTNEVPIESRRNLPHVKLVQDNSKYFIVHSEYIRYFCVQELAYRDENAGEVENRGNFVELTEQCRKISEAFLVG